MAAATSRGRVRTILVALAEAGPQTVSRLARARGQARQRIQPLMNALIRTAWSAPPRTRCTSNRR